MLSKNRMGKKGYFFTFDAIMGIIILIIASFIIYGMYFYSPDKVTTDDLARQVTGLLSSVKVSDLCSNLNSCECSYGTLTDLCNSGDIGNPDVSMMEFFGELYSKPADLRPQIASLIYEILIDNQIIPGNYGMKIMLTDVSTGEVHQLYPLEPIP